MCEELKDFHVDPLELFKTDLSHQDTQTHLRALSMLSTVAVALDVERSRHELLPYLEEYLQIHYFERDDVLAIIAEQLGTFCTFIGGPEYAYLLFPMLAKLAASDDTETGDKAVNSLKTIANLMNGQQLEEHFIRVIQALSEAEWFTSKCSAAPLFAVVYTKVSEECQKNLMNLFSNLLQDESPMVRRAAATSLTDFIKNAEMEMLKTEFIPSFKDLAKDDQDSVRILAVNVAIALSSRLTAEEIEEHIMSTLQALCVDTSWRVRYRCAFEINNIQLSVGPTLTRRFLVDMYKSFVRDTEVNIREISARNIVRFCEILQKTYVEFLENEEREEYLDPVIKKEILPLIKELDRDPAEDVQDGLYSVITSLSALLGEMNTKDFLVPLITSSIENDSSKVKENIISNLNNILCVIGIDELSKTVEKLMTDLLNNSNTLWRTRRNLIVTLSHIAKHSKKEYFDEHLKHLYLCLLNDPINGVRRVAPLALPLLTKHFTMTTWGKQNVVEIMLEFVGKRRYLLRLMCLFCIDELICPTLDKKGDSYLNKLKNIQDRNSSIVLNKIHKLNVILTENLRNEWIAIVLKYCEDESYFNDDIKIYAEDTLETLTKCVDHHIVAVSTEEIENHNEESYLEGLLFLIIVYFMDIIRELAQDKVCNVRMRSARTLHCIDELNRKLTAELNEPWVISVLDILSSEQRDKLGTDIQNDLYNSHNKFAEVRKEMLISFEEVVPDVPVLEAKDIKEEFEKMELEQKIAESMEITETLEKKIPLNMLETDIELKRQIVKSMEITDMLEKTAGVDEAKYFLTIGKQEIGEQSLKPDVLEKAIERDETNYLTTQNLEDQNKLLKIKSDEEQQSQRESSTNSVPIDATTSKISEAVFISDDIHV